MTLVIRTDADSVDLALMEDRFPDPGPMRHLPRERVWYIDVPLDADGSIEYRFAFNSAGRRRLKLDPTNPERARGPFGTNSVANGPEYRPPSWLDTEAGGGELGDVTIESRVWSTTRTHSVYLPPGHSPDREYPLLVMHDGPEFVEYAGLKRCLDALIGRQALQPMIVLLHQPADRKTEYVDHPSHISHVIGEVIPELRSSHLLGEIYAGGASLGAVAALSLAFHNPGVISGLLLQSGSFVEKLGGRFKRGKVLEPVTRLLPEVLAESHRLPPRIAVSVGEYDGLVEDHRALVPQLDRKVAHLHYEESRAGHHWRAWRDRLEPDLVALMTAT